MQKSDRSMVGSISRSTTPESRSMRRRRTCSDEDWHRVININLHAVFYCCREFGKVMLDQGKGSIINTASMSGIISNTPQPQSAYNVSKAGVIMLTKSLAGEWAKRGVRVNSISPGYIGTEMTKAGMSNLEWHADWLKFTPMGRRWRTARGRDRRGLSRVGCEQLFHRKQSGRRRRIYVLVRWSSGVAGVQNWHSRSCTLLERLSRIFG